MKYASLNNSHNKCHGNKYYTDRIFLEKHLFRSIIRSLRPTGRTPRFVLRLEDFYASGTQDIEEKNHQIQASWHMHMWGQFQYDN